MRHDTATERPLRDADGFCQRCAPDEAGEAIGRIAADPDAGPRRALRGLHRRPRPASAKVLRDVFAKGDAWFRTGDLMRLDRQGYFAFVDRIGDTFRWKGARTSPPPRWPRWCAPAPAWGDVCVYGVAAPGAEGRAGMAAVVAGAGFDLVVLRAHLAERLPAYARPLFVRLATELPATETFKLKKQALISQGFDPAQVGEPLYMDDLVAGAYVPLDVALYERLKAGWVRLVRTSPISLARASIIGRPAGMAPARA